MVKRLSILIVLALTLCAGPARGDHAPIEGFGAQVLYQVTKLDDDGSAGTLRHCVSQSDRRCEFTVGGTIKLEAHFHILGSNITIDGLTAPGPDGVTLDGAGLNGLQTFATFICLGTDGCHHLYVNDIRVRNSGFDGFQIRAGAHDVFLDHVSASSSADGNIDISEDAHRIVVQYSILSDPDPAGSGTPPHAKNSLVTSSLASGPWPRHLTFHHNLFIGASQRNPKCGYALAGSGAQSPETTCDIQNNVVANWQHPSGGHGTLVSEGARANVVNNFYSCPTCDAASLERAVEVCTAAHPCGLDPSNEVYTAGNEVHPPGSNPNRGPALSPLPAPPVALDTACGAVQKVLQSAGARPRDGIDLAAVGAVAQGSCASSPPVTVAFEMAIATDDAFKADSGFFSNGVAEVTFGGTTQGHNLGVRFVGASALAGKTILSAKLQLSCTTVTNACDDAVTMNIFGQKTPTTVTFSTVQDWDARLTGPLTAPVTGFSPGAWEQGANVATCGETNPPAKCGEIAVLQGIVQEIVGQPVWDGSIVIFLDSSTGATQRKAATFEHGSKPPPRLVITYQP